MAPADHRLQSAAGGDEREPWLVVAAEERVPLGSLSWATVVAVNAEVNRGILSTPDQEQYNETDVWEVVPEEGARRGRGDCEDYALSKRAGLIAEGLPVAALSIALGVTAWGEPHAVLLIATDGGDYVLDSLSTRIEHWSRSDLGWTSRQRPGDLLTWVGLGGE